MWSFRIRGLADAIIFDPGEEPAGEVEAILRDKAKNFISDYIRTVGAGTIRGKASGDGVTLSVTLEAHNYTE